MSIDNAEENEIQNNSDNGDSSEKKVISSPTRRKASRKSRIMIFNEKE